ncbi:MAG: hypothetical protein CME59_21475 [Halioglobus sp.]|nr:hypothetical protein [Halioglobus sp.]
MPPALRQLAHLVLASALLLPVALRADPATPVHDAYAGPGPWTVAVDAVTYASGQTGFVYRPVAGSGSEVFPVVVWGNGSGAAPEVDYPQLLRSIASYGFVVTATNHQQVGTGEPLLESLAHLRQLEADAGYVLHGQIDFAAVAAVGHSQGAGGSTRAAIHSDDIHTIVPLALPAPEFVFELEKAYDTADVDVPMFIIGAVGDFISDTPTVRAYLDAHPDAAYMAMVADSPAGFPHLEWSENGGGVSRAYIIAWLDYMLRGDAAAAQAFTGAQAEIEQHPAFIDQFGKCLPGGALPVLLPRSRGVPEGDAGSTTYAVTVELSAACDREVSVHWATVDDAGQGQAGVDYQPDSGILVFAPGETTQTIPFTVYGDTDPEPGTDGYEWSAIALTSPSNAELGADPASAFAFVLIRNDDLPPGCN